MTARIKDLPSLIADEVKALQGLFQMASSPGLPALTVQLAHLRASQINGCGVCVDMHSKLARKDGETEERLFAVAAWRDTPYFTEAERAALALTEAITRIADNPEAVSDAIWDEAVRHYDERTLVCLLLQVGLINLANRLNVATRQVAGNLKP
jgi:AhpD family alkylhydroperoxidase